MLNVPGAASAHNNPSPAVSSHHSLRGSAVRGAGALQCCILQSSSLQSFMLHTAHHVMTSSVFYVFPHVGSLQTLMLQCCMLQCDGQLSTTGQHVSGCLQRHSTSRTRDTWPQHSLRGGSFQWLVSSWAWLRCEGNQGGGGWPGVNMLPHTHCSIRETLL